MSVSKSGYELLPPPEYAEAVKESAPPYNSEDLEAYQEPAQPFQTGLFECFGNPGLVLKTLFCTPCVFGSTTRLLAEDVNDTTADRSYTSWVHVDTPVYAILQQSSLQFIVGGVRRGVIRKALNREGSAWKDWAAHLFCGPCAVAQENTEVRRYRREMQARMEPSPATFRQEQALLAAELDDEEEEEEEEEEEVLKK